MRLTHSIVTTGLVLLLSACGGQSSTGQGMSGMNHEGMASGTPASKDVDKAFLIGMVPHHQAAIDMAKVEVQKGKDPQAKQLAQMIIDDQQREIGQMQEIAKASFNVTPATSMAMGGTEGTLMSEPIVMDMGTMGHAVDVAPDTDKAFLQLMIPHHAMAISMAASQQKAGTDPKIKQLSQAIIASQAKEIGQMQGMLAGK